MKKWVSDQGKESKHSELWVAYDTQWTEGASACSVSVLLCCKGLRAALLPTFTAPACLPPPFFSSLFQLAEKTHGERGSERKLQATGDASSFWDEQLRWQGIRLHKKTVNRAHFFFFFFSLHPTLRALLLCLNGSEPYKSLNASRNGQCYVVKNLLKLKQERGRKQQDRYSQRFFFFWAPLLFFFPFLCLTLLLSDRCSRGLRRSRRDRAHASRQRNLHFLPSRWKLLGFFLFLGLSLEEN